VSFEEILRQWEERDRSEGSDSDGTRKNRRRREELEALLDRYPPDPSEKGEAEPARRRHRPSPRSLPIDDELDLHGLTVEEARDTTARFLEASLAAGYRKVLIVHGKGLHSQNGGVLGSAIRRFLESHPDTGAMGTPKQRDGGSGALWVVLRHRSR